MRSLRAAVERDVEPSPDDAISRQSRVDGCVCTVWQLGVNVEEKQGVAGSDSRSRILLGGAPTGRRHNVITKRTCQRVSVVAAATISHNHFRATLA